MNPFKTQPHICGGTGTVRYLTREKDAKGKLLPIRRPFPRDAKRSKHEHVKAFFEALQTNRADVKAFEEAVRGDGEVRGSETAGQTVLPPRRLKASYPTEAVTTCWCVDRAKAKADLKARLAAKAEATKQAVP